MTTVNLRLEKKLVNYVANCYELNSLATFESLNAEYKAKFDPSDFLKKMDDQNNYVEELKSQLREKDEQLVEITNLVSRVRHDINNPLTGVIGQAQLLLRSELDPKARHRVETIEQLAGRIRDIVAELRVVQQPNNSHE